MEGFAKASTRSDIPSSPWSGLRYKLDKLDLLRMVVDVTNDLRYDTIQGSTIS